MNFSLKRIIKLIQKTGDRFIVSDSDYETPYAIMSLADYEKMVFSEKESVDDYFFKETSEDQLLEKINKDIAVWRSQQEKMEENLSNLQSQENIEEKKEEINSSVWENNSEKEPEKETEEDGGEDRYYFEPLES